MTCPACGEPLTVRTHRRADHSEYERRYCAACQGRRSRQNAVERQAGKLLLRCLLPRPHGRDDAFLRGQVDCGYLAFAREAADHLRGVHGIADGADMVGRCFGPVSPVEDVMELAS